MALQKELLEILVCPKCKGELKYDETQGLACNTCKLLYKIENDIPVMLVEEAVELNKT